MIRKFMTMAAAATLALGALAPVAEARDGHWGGRGGYYDGHRGHYRYYHGRYYNDHGDAVAAGVVGLILGLAVGSAVSAPRDNRGCYDRCDAPPPPPQYQGYDPGQDQGYDQGDSGSAYEQDYGTAPPKQGGYPQARQCTRSERQWDRYANRYVTVDVPC
jgi:hypothetical protein